MKRHAFLLLACLSAVGPGTLLFPAVAGAIPDYPGPSSGATQWPRGHRPGRPALISEQTPGPNGNPVRPGHLPSDRNTCRQDIAGATQDEAGTGDSSCVDSLDAQQRLSIRLGRNGSRGDILGELNGLRVGYRLSDQLKLNAIAGYPVPAAKDSFNAARQVLGINAATHRLGGAWDLNGYLLEQFEDGHTDDESLGGVIRYLQPGRSFLVCIDYDVASNSLGTSTASGAWRLPFKTTVSTTLDRRSRALPGRQQGYLRQSMSAMEGWNLILPADRLAHYTGDARGEVSTLAVGLSRALSRRIRLSSDVAVLEATNDPTPETATTVQSSEYVYHFKLTGKDLILPGERSKLDVRYNVTETGRTSTAAFDTKYPINRSWKIMPRLRSDYHSRADAGTPRWVTAPTVKMEYRRNKQSGFQIEAGGEWTTGVKSTADDSRSSYFISLGYKAKF
jgi:hypothetical protein